jgi:hypothetical protein
MQMERVCVFINGKVAYVFINGKVAFLAYCMT